MALLKGLSIKWKLSLSLILSGLILVGTYVVIAKQTFESDKISYVFDSQGARLDSLRSEINGKIERSLLSARSVIATYDYSQGRLSEAGEQIFREEKRLIALELWSEERNESVFRVEKDPSALPVELEAPSPVGEVELRTLTANRYLLTLRYSQGGQGTFRLRAVVEMPDLLPQANSTMAMALLQGKRLVASSDLHSIGTDLFNEIANESKEGPEYAMLQTRILETGGERFLVSEIPMHTAGLRLVAMTPESDALGALATLFNRSVIFLMLSFFCLIIVSLTLSKGMTRDLQLLTVSAQEIGSGNFDAVPTVRSEDEIGVLSGAFAKMSQEIKRLLFETREKTRMEAELKTASLIQERLLPDQGLATMGSLEIQGLVLTSSECGGDWWFHFQKGSDLYVAIADATGHGTPAALITAAARAIFSRLEREDLTLQEMMQAWDIAVASCSQKQVFMTGILMRLNFETGEGALVSAAHESPFWFHQDQGAFVAEHVDLDVSSRLGDGIGTLVEKSFNLGAGDSLVLYTDGLFSVVNNEGKDLNERRFLKKVASKMEQVSSAKEMTELILHVFDEHRQGLPLPDDVSIVSIRRNVST